MFFASGDELAPAFVAQKYGKRQQQMNTQQWYHGTSHEAAASIQQHGFRIGETPRNNWGLGVGIYFGPRWIAGCYGKAIIAATINTHIYDWNDSICEQARTTVLWLPQDRLEGLKTRERLIRNNTFARIHPERSRQLAVMMQKHGVHAVSFMMSPKADRIYWSEVIEVAVYDVSVIRVTDVLFG